MSVTISDQTLLVEKEIESVKAEQTKSDRLEFYSGQKELLLTYILKILGLLYLIVYIILVISIVMKRQNIGLFMAIILVMFFGVFPFIVDYVARYAYYRWLDLVHYIYAGNAIYLYQPPK